LSGVTSEIDLRLDEVDHFPNQSEERSVPIYMRFAHDIKTSPSQIALHAAEVHGFAAGIEPTQADADAVAARLDEVYAELPPAQQAVLASLLQQAAGAST
jgi:hypothetical protein